MGRTTATFKPILQRLAAPTDTASLVLLRVSFGLLMLWEVIRFFSHGWVEHLYARPEFHFKYAGFTWVEAWPGYGMHLHFAALGVLAVLIALGLFYRVASLLFFLGYTYVFLVERAHYNNHYYLICLLSFLLALAPLHRSWSLDALRGAVSHSDRFPTLWLWLFRLQMGIVYFYGGLAKFDPDWLNGQAPGALFKTATRDTPMQALLQFEWFPLFFGWSGLLFDLLIPFALIWRRTRLLGLFVALLFHTSNLFIWNIGIFPVLALALTLLFLDPDFPRRLLPLQLKSRINNWYHQRLRSPKSENITLPLKPVLILIGVYVTWQLLLPFRHWTTPGWTSWHQDGHLFAWRMMLRNKNTKVLFLAQHPDTEETRHAPPRDYLTAVQYKQIGRNPDMVLQFAHHLRDLIRQNAGFTPKILFTLKVAINGREYVDQVPPELDLGKVRPFTPAHQWVIPFPRDTGD